MTSSNCLQVNSSYRDPAGYVYECNGIIYRSVREFGRQQYELLKQKNIIFDLIDKKYLIPTKELNANIWPEKLKNSAYVLQHDTVPYVSYPYEWSFYQLKDAALHHLNLQIYLLENGFVLKDASAYNIQFIGTTPIFIDLLSLKAYEHGEYWLGYNQFCEQFLNPLLLRTKLDIPHNNWYRGSIEGISTLYLDKLIPWHKKMSWRMLSHIHLKAKFEKAAIKNQNKKRIKNLQSGKLSKLAYEGFLQQMKAWIENLHPDKNEKSIWSDYHSSNSYLDSESSNKKKFISEFYRQEQPKLLIDLGCNNGDYSMAAIESGIDYVVGIDSDQKALDLAYNKAVKHKYSFLPLYVDAANPSPNQGWLQLERTGFKDRFRADAVIALAFIHHLAIAKNIPLAQIIKWVTNIAPTGVIEFIPKNDPMIVQMLLSRADIFMDYTRDNFESIISKESNIIMKKNISKSGRCVYWYKNK